MKDFNGPVVVGYFIVGGVKKDVYRKTIITTTARPSGSQIDFFIDTSINSNNQVLLYGFGAAQTNGSSQYGIPTADPSNTTYNVVISLATRGLCLYLGGGAWASVGTTVTVYYYNK